LKKPEKRAILAQDWWCSILVGEIASEGGAKNPPKGTSMKLLVLALNAQFGVDAGR
jgi:hypothetical protein